MAKIINFFVFYIFFHFPGSCQYSCNQNYFKNTIWASGFGDSSFFKLDTVKLIMIKGDLNLNDEDNLDITDHFMNSDFLKLEFASENKMKLSITNVTDWTVSHKNLNYNWYFNKKKCTLSLYHDSKIFALFVPLFENKVEIKSSYSNKKPINSTELILKRLKILSLNR